MLTNLLFGQVCFINEEICIRKERVYSLLKLYRPAYRELLQNGVLHEYHATSEYTNWTEIRVRADIMATYFMAKKLLAINNYAINGHTLELISLQDYPENTRNSILRWLVVFSLESGDLMFVNELIRKSYSSPDDDRLIIFCCNSICNLGSQNVGLHSKLADQLNHSPFIEYALLFPSLQPSYSKALNQLLSFPLTEKNKIFIHSKLGLLAFLRLDNKETSRQIDLLKGCSRTTLSSFALNPLYGLEAMHNYLRHGTISTASLRALTRYYFRPESHRAGKQHEVILTIALCCGMLSNHPRKVVRLINSIERSIYRNPSTVTSEDFKTSIALLKSLELMRAGEYQKASANLAQVKRTNTHKFNQVLGKIIRVLLGESPYPNASFQVSHLLGIVSYEQMTLFEVYIRRFLIEAGNDVPPEIIEGHRDALRRLVKKTKYRVSLLKNWTLPVATSKRI